MRNKKVTARFLLIGCMFGILVSCQVPELKVKEKEENKPFAISGSSVAVSFAPDGRLWRLISSQEAVYVDHSDNNGETFKQAVKVNKTAQKINAWPENPPAITVSKSGRIHVIFYADAAQKAMTFFSYSDDNGLTFSTPELVSDHALTDMHYMDKMLVNEDDRIFLMWHDMRDETLNEALGSGVISLYFATTASPGDEPFLNKKVSDGICSCCRTALNFSPDGQPVVMVRMVFPEGVRDHAMLRLADNGIWSKPQRVTEDQWRIEACPEHGPALSIDNQGRSHLTWFTLGEIRQGIFYAYTDDYGKTLSSPMQLGNADRLPAHPDVLTLGQQVVLAWKEFDGKESSIVVKVSQDRGGIWQQESKILVSRTKSGHPVLISNGKSVFLSWTTQDKGHQFIEIL